MRARFDEVEFMIIRKRNHKGESTMDSLKDEFYERSKDEEKDGCFADKMIELLEILEID